MAAPFTAVVSYEGSIARASSAAGSSSSASTLCLALTGAGTKTIDFGTVSKAKLLAVHVPREGNTAPISVRLNGSASGVEVSPGGFLCLASPNPASGVTSASIEYTVDSLVYCDILG